MPDDSLGERLDVRTADLLLIHHRWMGRSEHSPVVAAYSLHRGARGGFIGEATFSTGLVAARVVEIKLPAAAAMRFLDLVSGARVVEGAYRPLELRSDDHPRIELCLRVPAGGMALVYTASHGAFHAPWGAVVAGEILTLPGDEVGRAFASIRAPMKLKHLEKMMQ